MKTNFDKVKEMTIDEMAQWVREECLYSHFNGCVLDKDSIKRWLEKEAKDDIDF